MRTYKLLEEDKPRVLHDLEFARRANNKANGIYYTDELAGPGGADFTLYPAEGTSDEDLIKAEEEIRHNQDAFDVFAVYVPAEMVADDDRDRPSATEEEKIGKIRRIVEEQSFDKVDGVGVDLFSASAIIQVYDAINEENKRKYAALSIGRMADIAFKLMK